MQEKSLENMSSKPDWLIHWAFSDPINNRETENVGYTIDCWMEGVYRGENHKKGLNNV